MHLAIIMFPWTCSSHGCRQWNYNPSFHSSTLLLPELSTSSIDQQMSSFDLVVVSPLPNFNLQIPLYSLLCLTNQWLMKEKMRKLLA